MSEHSTETRARIRELVRQVLDAVPSEASQSKPEAVTEHVIVNSLREKMERDWDRDESAKSLLTEDDLRGLEPGSRLRVAENVKLTPLASDIVAERSINLIKKIARKPQVKVRSVAIGADHGGFKAKEALKAFLAEMGLNLRDLGTDSEDAVDYPDIAHAVAKCVAGRQAEVGIIIDGAGIGSAMAANKVPGVRAAACYNEVLVRNSREHNGANILTLGSGQNSLDEMKSMIEVFLSTDIGEERHQKRVAKIDSIDREYRR